MRVGNYYFGSNYFTQRLLDITQECSQTSMQELIDLSLFTLCPELKDPDEWRRWTKCIADLQQHFGHMQDGSDKRDIMPFGPVDNNYM